MNDNFRILEVIADDLHQGDRVLCMGIILAEGGSRKFDMKPCKLQMEVVDIYKNRVWVDVPFEKIPAHPYANIGRDKGDT